MAVDENGYFTDRITDFRGKYVKEADNDITQAVKARDSNTPLFLWHYNVRAFNFYEQNWLTTAIKENMIYHKLCR